MTEDSSSEYCCAPASACTENQEGTSCSSGEVLSFYSTVPCNATGRCYNDFFASEHLTRFAHYTCQDKCINWEDMCRGVSFCAGDEKACGPSLRCPYGTTQYNMSTIPVRYYCLDNDFSEKKNNGSYDLIDRTDEDISVSKVTSAQSINYTALAHCTDGDYGAGVECEGYCEHTATWCNDKFERYCDDSGVWPSISGVWMTDPRLCSHPTFWQDILSCNYTDYLGHFYPGVRCTGAIKHCYYTQAPPDYDDYYPTTCRDKSDRVFQVGEPCQDTPDNICWESCDSPGPGCSACSNKTYFQCPKSKQCIHPSLKCDGIP